MADKETRIPRTSHNPETIKLVGGYVCAGIKTVLEISSLTGVPQKTIRRWRIKYNWQPVLTEKIRAETERKLAGASLDDEKAVEEASNQQVELIGHHKKCLAAARKKVMDALEALPDIHAEKDGDVRAKLAMLYLNAGQVAGSALKNIIPLERQAYCLDDKEKQNSSYDDLVLLMSQNDA
jgi:hypothetical protein